jgi:ethanolamine utilization protein EutN
MRAGHGAYKRTRAVPVAPIAGIFAGVYLARVVGRVVATIKQDTLAAVTLQWIQPVSTTGADAGKPLVAVDRVGVGPGELVYYITSREAALTLENPFAAVDAGIVGKVDWVDVGGTQTLRADPAPTER